MFSQSISLYNQLAKQKLFKRKINFSLKRIRKVLRLLDNPERKLKSVINIIGSDGKYSVLTSLKFFIEENNQKVSAFISPSLFDIRERFWIGERYLSYNEIKKTIKLIKKFKVPLTIFELFTLIYIINVCNEENEYNLIEAGALFAKDSTNLFDFPKSQIVVNINKQHLNFVKKKTIKEIINQKVGYLSKFTKIYIGEQNKDNLKIIKKILKKNASEKVYSQNWKLVKKKNKYFYKDSNSKIFLNSRNINSTGLLKNLCLAIKVAKDLGIEKNVITKAIPKIKFEGRVQFIRKGKIKKKLFRNEKLIIDGCHSKISAENFVKYLKTINLPKYGIWGMTANKDPSKFLKVFRGIFKKIVTVPIESNPNFISPKSLKNVCKENNIICDHANGLSQAVKIVSSKESKLICVFGSLYLCGDLLKNN